MFCKLAGSCYRNSGPKATNTVLWVNPGRQLSTMQLLPHCPQVGWGRAVSLVKQKQCMQAKQMKEFIHYCSSTCRCSAFSEKTGLHHV